MDFGVAKKETRKIRCRVEIDFEKILKNPRQNGAARRGAAHLNVISPLTAFTATGSTVQGVNLKLSRGEKKKKLLNAAG